MADYCWVYGVIHFTSHAGWLPVHRNQLRVQRSVTSMGKLYLYFFKVSSDVTGSDPNTSSAAAAATGQKSDSAAHLLASIRDLVATKLHCDAQLRREAAENERLVREWTTAAKVVDRICFVTHCVVLIAGSAIFLTLLFWLAPHL